MLSSCLENGAYPTILFYEKLVSFEEDALYEQRRGFDLVKIELDTLQKLANRLAIQNGTDGFGDDAMIEE